MHQALNTLILALNSPYTMTHKPAGAGKGGGQGEDVKQYEVGGGGRRKSVDKNKSIKPGLTPTYPAI